MKNRIIVALDGIQDKTEIFLLAEKLSEYVGGFKVSAQIDRYGVDIITDLKEYGLVMSDVKIVDIPSNAVRRVEEHVDAGADFVTVYGGGGWKMLKACSQVAPTQLIAVTVLTSFHNTDSQKIFGASLKDKVAYFAELASTCGVSGIVCAPRDLVHLPQTLKAGFIKITPGVRPAWSRVRTDQNTARTMTPQDALRRGANYIVIGRPIISAQNPEQAAERVLCDIEG